MSNFVSNDNLSKVGKPPFMRLSVGYWVPPPHQFKIQESPAPSKRRRFSLYLHQISVQKRPAFTPCSQEYLDADVACIKQLIITQWFEAIVHQAAVGLV